MTKNFVKIIMGSERDFEFCQKIGEALGKLKIPFQYRVASAHKTPRLVLKILKAKSDLNLNLVYITVAGRSNALSGFVDANTHRPVIACPPYSEKFSGADIFSSLRMPSGSGLVTVLEPEAAALVTAKILALSDKKLEEKIKYFQNKLKRKVTQADKEVRKHGER